MQGLIVRAFLLGVVLMAEAHAQEGHLYIVPPDTNAVDAMCVDITRDPTAVGILNPSNTCEMTCTTTTKDQFKVNQPDGESCRLSNDNGGTVTSICYRGQCYKNLQDKAACVAMGLDAQSNAILKPGEPCTVLCVPAPGTVGLMLELPIKLGTRCYVESESGQCIGNKCTIS